MHKLHCIDFGVYHRANAQARRFHHPANPLVLGITVKTVTKCYWTEMDTQWMLLLNHQSLESGMGVEDAKERSATAAPLYILMMTGNVYPVEEYERRRML